MRRWITTFLRSPAGLFVIGVVGTIVLAVGVVIALLRTGDPQAVSDNAPLIAAVIALGGVGTAQMVSIALDNRRTHESQDLEAQRAGEAALQNYIEAVGELLIEKSLHRASPGDNLSIVVRAQTLSVLEDLQPNRKRILVRFLYESRLILESKPVISLSFANLSFANLGYANLSNTDLREAFLIGANLRRANLIGANLIGADLSGADLSEAFLSNAVLSDAYGLTDEELEQQALSLEGATMPNGQKYEDWLQDKESRGGD